ncbi:MAG TPA: dihydrofolate reductase family protein [Candidatus Limnocylindrales bacterium]|nr:dihydrofolate reductase family protein [Candidatus Limnocylindrales bacterium]
MSKLIMWNLITLDGFFDGPENWALDWHQYAWGEELERLSIEQLRSADMLLFGRVTYVGMAAYWKPAQGEVATFMNSLPKAVFSRTLNKVDWQNTKLLTGDVKQEVEALKRAGDQNIFVFGSGGLSATLLEEGLFDEYRLCLVPVVLGSGKQLFGRKLSRLRMRLLQSRALASGSILLHYAPFAEATPESASRSTSRVS